VPDVLLPAEDTVKGGSLHPMDEFMSWW